MPFPSISIVTPSYNQAQYLDQTIQSVLDQKYPNLQYMVIDGGSTDGSVEVIKKYEKHLNYWVSEKDTGQCDALNKGVRRSTGEIFGFINSDDFYYPGAFQRVADTWNLGAKWIVGWSKYLELEGSDYPYTPRAHHRPIDYFLDNPFPQQSSFWAKSLFDEVGLFREDLHYCFDYEFWMRLRFKSSARPWVVRQCMGAFRYHETSKTVHDWSKSEAAFTVIRAEYDHYLSRYEKLKLWNGRRQIKATEAKKRLWRAIKDRKIETARKEAVTVMGQQPLALDSWRNLYHALVGH